MATEMLTKYHNRMAQIAIQIVEMKAETDGFL